MELRRLVLCFAVLVTVFLQSSESRHSIHPRAADDDYDVLNDDADALNMGDGEDEDPLPAKIVNPGVTYNKFLGETVVLECQIQPTNSGAVVEWSKNNDRIFMNKHKMLASDRYALAPHSHNLIIKQLEPSDAGVYKCDILQELKSTIYHTLNVSGKPKILEFVASSTKVLEGSSVTLHCNVSGSPTPTILWSRDKAGGNVALKESEGSYTFQPNNVVIEKLKVSDSGTYYCYALNDLGSATEQVDITVIPKMRVHVHKLVVNSAINVTAVLQCTVHHSWSNDDTPSIIWYKDDKPINFPLHDNFILGGSGTSSNLTVIPKSDEDFGTFTCEAETPQEKHNKSVALVQSPVIEDFTVDGNKLTWKVNSHQPLEQIELQLRRLSEDNELKRINVPIPEKLRHEYSLTYLLSEDQYSSGNYEAIVKAKNSHSWSEPVDPAVVKIEIQPQFIQHASVFYTGNGNSIRPTALLSTVIMYLLVRMF